MVKNPPELQTLVQLDQLLAFAETSATTIWLAGAGAEHWFKLHKLPPPGCELIANIDQFHTKAQQRHFFR
jgi:hypothetical protein